MPGMKVIPCFSIITMWYNNCWKMFVIVRSRVRLHFSVLLRFNRSVPSIFVFSHIFFCIHHILCYSEIAYLFVRQPGPDSIGIIAISHGCAGVASRACGLVGLEPTRVSSDRTCFLMANYHFIAVIIISLDIHQVAEILKDRPSWYRDCRTVDVLNVLSTGNGGTIELLYMQVDFHFFSS